jgi:uncharacterized protein YutE (UPF0331/DUF86 family)
VLENIFKRGYKEISDRKLLEILKKDLTPSKYVNKFIFGYRKLSNMDRVKQQDYASE